MFGYAHVFKVTSYFYKRLLVHSMYLKWNEILLNNSTLPETLRLKKNWQLKHRTIWSECAWSPTSGSNQTQRWNSSKIKKGYRGRWSNKRHWKMDKGYKWSASEQASSFSELQTSHAWFRQTYAGKKRSAQGYKVRRGTFIILLITNALLVINKIAMWVSVE